MQPQIIYQIKHQIRLLLQRNIGERLYAIDVTLRWISDRITHIIMCVAILLITILILFVTTKKESHLFAPL